MIALTRALELSQGKNVNIYTDSKYSFMLVHAHGEVWKERGLLTSGNKGIKHAREFYIAEGSESTEPDCHNALPRTPEGQFPNKLGKPNC